MAASIEASEFNNQPYSVMDNTAAFLLTLATMTLPAMISTIDTKIGLITFVAGGTATAVSVATEIIRNRNTSEGDHPKPLAAENKPDKLITIVSFKPANAIG
jgi:hypothetical protein